LKEVYLQKELSIALSLLNFGGTFYFFQLKMELSSAASLTSVGLSDVDGFGGLLGIPLGQPHALEAHGTKRRR
jgi:hypothetical protein